MSTNNRYSNNKRFTNSNNTQKKFIPKTPISTTPPSSDPNPNPTTLSSSLRQQSNPAVATTTVGNSNITGTSGGSNGGRGRGRGRGGGSGTSSSSRVRIGDKGDWTPSNKAANGGYFVNYLPQDEAVAAGFGADDGGLDPLESQRVVDLLNRELSNLLKLSPRDFWKEVAEDNSFHEFMDSFLQFRSRWYDFPYHGAKGIVAGLIVGESELSRRVFMLLYRISSCRDPGARGSDSLSAKDHGVILQEKRLLDLPKLLDICALYGHENEDLTKVLVSNAINVQPWIHGSLTPAVAHFLRIGHTLYERCNSSLKVLFSSEGSVDHNFSRLHADFLEVMDFINDAIVSMDAFVTSYNPAAVFFSCPVDMSNGNEELLITLARLHDSLLPSLQRGFKIIYTTGEHKLQIAQKGILSEIIISLKMLSTRIVKFGWKLLDLCYLSDEVFKVSLPLPESTKMFPATVEDPGIRADILIQTFREINGASGVMDSSSRGTFLQHAEKSYEVLGRFEGLQSTGWVHMDDGQLQFLYKILRHSSRAINTNQSPSSNEVQMTDVDAIMESKISQIKDLFPDYGKGFLSACLEAYNHNPEDVIQRILEGSLHEDLQSLDTSLETAPPRKSASSASKNDKGKGILLPTSVSPKNHMPAVQYQVTVGPSSRSSSSTPSGRFVRKSKTDVPSSLSLDSRDERDLAKTSALVSQMEYEDEYDDSFDDLGLTVGDFQLEESESLGNNGRSSRPENETTPANPSNSSKWGSRQKPQFYVKDGKNYSYKVEGAVGVANSSEAQLLNQTQKDMIYGLGKGGNHPQGVVHYKKVKESADEQNEESDTTENEAQDNTGIGRGRGRGGGRRGGRSNHYRKDQAMKKHFAGIRF